MTAMHSPAHVAFKTMNDNTASRWFKKDIDVADTTGPYAVQKLGNERFVPSLNAAFTINPSDKVFAIGSCFARGIEKTLIGRGFDVVSAAKEFDAFELSGPEVTGLGFTNKYTTFSILNDVGWALNTESAFPEASIVDVGDVSIDPHTNPSLKFADRDTTLERRSIITQINRRIRECRVVMMTLGLVEAWYDTQADVYINMTPTPDMVRAFPGRYEFRLSNQSESVANLQAIHGMLDKWGHPEVEVVITVSPVPLMATFTDRDVVVANTYSKATLRSAAEEFAFGHANVHYFPSYEMAINSNPSFAWEADGRHVRGEMTQHIMRQFAHAYVDA